MVESKKKRVHITLSQDSFDKVEETSNRYGITPNAFISFIVGQWVDANYEVSKVMSDKVDEFLPDLSTVSENPQFMKMVKAILSSDQDFKDAARNKIDNQ